MEAGPSLVLVGAYVVQLVSVNGHLVDCRLCCLNEKHMLPL